jgi:hypothetical protein
MSTPPKPALHLKATCLGPVAKLDAPLSKNARNMIYARNGTGKSFITRALRYLDLHVQQSDISDAAFNLVSEEAVDGRGSFSLTQGTATIGSLSLDNSNSSVTASCPDRIFHVFSDDFVHAELRQNEYELDGDIESEITLDQENIDTKDAEKMLESIQKDSAKSRLQLQSLLETKKSEELVGKASINRQLREYRDIGVDRLIALTEQPPLPERTFKTVLGDLDALKAIPADPEYPTEQSRIVIEPEGLRAVDALLSQITSPSTVSDHIKTLLESNPKFFETGLEMLEHGTDDDCPFCKQSVAHPPAKDRIELYLAYFADAEGKHKAELRSAWSDVKALRSMVGGRVASIAKEALKFEALRKLVPSQRSVVLPDISAAANSLDAAFEAYLQAIQTKGTSPSSEVSAPDHDIFGHLEKLNHHIDAFAKLSAAVRQSDDERKSLHREACLVFSLEFSHSNWSEIAAINLLGQEAAAAEAELAALKKSQVSASVKDRVAQTFELLISSFFGTKYSFDRSAFVLRRESKKMARGASRTLSDGEKTAIAFCYFLACAHKKVKQTSDYAKLFFVFDDPITSMSYDFVFSIAQTLKNMSISNSGEFSINPADIGPARKPELLILTHSSYFYNICVTNRVIEKEAAFFLYKAGNEHKLANRAKYAAPFEEHLKEIVEVHGGREANHTTGNAVRCVLEAIGRFCHPDKSETLSEFIKFLAGEENFIIKSVLINNLSHGTYYDETPSPEELKEACGEAILIVERYARGQLELVRLMSPTSTTMAA